MARNSTHKKSWIASFSEAQARKAKSQRAFFLNFIRELLFGVSQWLTRQQKQTVFWTMDALMAPFCFYLACAFTYASIWPMEQIVRLAVIFPTLAIIGGFASQAFNLTRVKLKSYQSFFTSGIIYYAIATGLGALLLTNIKGLYFPVVGNLVFFLILFLMSISVRFFMLNIYLWALRYNKVPVRVLIYGAGETGLQLASALKAHDTIRLVAFLDDDPNIRRVRHAGFRVLDPNRLDEIVRNHEIGRVILALSEISAPKQARIVRKMQALGLEVQILPSFAQLAGPETLIDTLTSLQPRNFLGRAGLEASISHSDENYRGRVVMVTGAGGSVGSELCRQLLSYGTRKIVLFEISEIALYTIERELREGLAEIATQIVPVLGSVADGRAVRQALEAHNVDIVIHAAAYKHVPLVEDNPITGLLNNAVGTRTLADACLKHEVERFLLISTDKAVRPTNVMGASKRMAEMVVQDMARRSKKTQFSIVRFGNVLGSSGSVIPLFKDQISHGGPVTLTHEDVTRYFMTISEAVRLVLLAGAFSDISRRQNADVFVLDMGQPVLIRDLAEQLINAAGYTVRDEQNPNGDIEIKVVGLRPGEKLHEELLIGGDMQATPHPKIMRASEVSDGTGYISIVLQELVQIAAAGDTQAARSLALEVASGNAKNSTLKTAANLL